MEIYINNRVVVSKDFSDTEIAWSLEDAILVLDFLSNKDIIVLGGDILTNKMKYNYDSWYYNPDINYSLTTNAEFSIKSAKKYLSNYMNINGQDFFVVFVIQ